MDFDSVNKSTLICLHAGMCVYRIEVPDHVHVTIGDDKCLVDTWAHVCCEWRCNFSQTQGILFWCSCNLNMFVYHFRTWNDTFVSFNMLYYPNTTLRPFFPIKLSKSWVCKMLNNLVLVHLTSKLMLVYLNIVISNLL